MSHYRSTAILLLCSLAMGLILAAPSRSTAQVPSTLTPSAEPTFASGPVLEMNSTPSELKSLNLRGSFFVTVPRYWSAVMIIRFGEEDFIQVSSSVGSILKSMGGTQQSPESVLGDLHYLSPEQLRTLNLSVDAPPADVLRSLYDARQTADQAKPALLVIESFTLDERDGAAAVLTCKNCPSTEQYLVTTQVRNGYFYSLFGLKTFKIDEYRDTLRTIAASASFMPD